MKIKFEIDSVLSLVSNPLRRRIIDLLSFRKCLTFSELMEYCGLDIFQQCGLMDYHLKILVDSQTLEKGEGYKLTEYVRFRALSDR